MAFAFPILVVMLWAFVQLAEVYRAAPDAASAGRGCALRDAMPQSRCDGLQCPATRNRQLASSGYHQAKILNSVAGIGSGTFSVSDPVGGNTGTARYYDLTVSYWQDTDLLMFRGPRMTVRRSKRVWLATST